jgi:hypothetical protein
LTLGKRERKEKKTLKICCRKRKRKREEKLLNKRGKTLKFAIRKNREMETLEN